tara:strand:- start:12737 stop:13549 length:813 start_codon:yes stop_codon:yes gene_type:complete
MVKTKTKVIQKIAKGIVCIDNFLEESYLEGILGCINDLSWKTSYSQGGERSSIQYKTKNYKKSIVEYKIIESLRKFLFSEENISKTYSTLEAHDGKLKYSLSTILNNLDLRTTEKGLNDNFPEKIFLKFIRNPLYKFEKIKKLSREMRKLLCGPKFHTTFSISSTNGSYYENPHVDQQNKLFVGLLYLDDSNLKSSTNLTFWNVKKNNILKFDKNLYVVDTPLEKITNIQQKRNRLILFKNNKEAIHSAKGNTKTNRRFIYFSLVASNDF